MNNDKFSIRVFHGNLQWFPLKIFEDIFLFFKNTYSVLLGNCVDNRVL